MRMQNAEMEFVTFDAQDVITTSIIVNYLYAGNSAKYYKDHDSGIPGYHPIVDQMGTKNGPYSSTGIGNIITGFDVATNGLNLNGLLTSPLRSAQSGETLVGIDVTTDSSFMTTVDSESYVDMKAIFDWLQAAENGYKVQ